MSEQLDKFPTLGICVSCGAEIKYSPVRMPLGRPRINAERPGHFSIEYGPMCVPCIRNQTNILMEKVNLGEMYPLDTWEQAEDSDSFHIVPIMQSSAPVEAKVDVEESPSEPKPKKAGIIQRLFKWIY